MSYTDEDLERAVALWAERGVNVAVRVAETFADIRRETREATIRECLDAIAGLETAQGARNCILALITPPSAPAEPKCKHCGAEKGDWGHLGHHNFEPEEPGT